MHFDVVMPATSFRDFEVEIVRLKTRWAMAADKPATIGEAIKNINRHLSPNIFTCLAILATMPVSTATAERSFSVMRRVKTYLRSTMTTERLLSLALLHAYKDVDVNVNTVIDEFATTGLEDLLTNGSLHGSLSAIKKWC